MIRLPANAGKDEAAAKPASFAGLLTQVHDVILAFPELTPPGVDAKIRNGLINIFVGDRRIFEFNNLQASYKRPFTRTEFALSCKSNMWHSISINGSLDTETFTSKGTIQLAQFQPQRLSEYFFPDSGLRLTEASANLTVDFETRGPQWLQANLHGTIPDLKLANGEHTLTIAGQDIVGSAQIDRHRATISIEKLQLKYPNLEIAATFLADELQPLFTLDLEGRHIDVDEVRKAAIALSAKASIVRDVFAIIKGGKVPQIQLHAQGSGFADLVDPDNMVIQGRMQDGKLFIPVAELDLDAVEGTAVISGGLLVGTSLKAKMGKSSGNRGHLKLGLNKNLSPFQLDIAVQADLSQLPPVLERVVDDEDFLTELARIEECRGTAFGKLVLGIESDRVDVTVEASKVHLEGRHRQIPYPVRIEGGQFFFDGHQIAIDRFDVFVGGSSFSQISSTLAWKSTTHLELSSGPATLDMKEVYYWLVSFRTLAKYLEPVESVNGTINLNGLNLFGPMFSPKNWQIQSRGELENIIITSSKLPRPLEITQGRISYRGQQVKFENVIGKLGTSSFSQLSTEIKWVKALSLELNSESVILALDQIYPWLISFSGPQDDFKDYAVAGGTVVLKDLELKGPLGQPDDWRLSSDGELQNISVASKRFDEPVVITHGKFILAERKNSGILQNCLLLGSTRINWGNSHLTLSGDIFLSKPGLTVDMQIAMDAMEWARIAGLLNGETRKNDRADAGQRQKTARGTLRVRSEQFTYESYTFSPVEVKITFDSDEVLVTVENADLCDIALNGIIKILDRDVEYDLIAASKSEELEASLMCFSKQKAAATGKFALDGEIMAKMNLQTNSRVYSGKLNFSAQNGRIYRMGLLAKILAILNVTEIYRGEVPDLTGEGFAYNTITAQAEFQGTQLLLKECFIDGASMGIASKGEIDIVEEKINLIVLVAPFKTMDRIVKEIPLINSILGGKLVSIPFSAVGDIDKYRVIPLSPTGVGSELLGIMERTLRLPITIIQPLFPNNGNEEKKNAPLGKD
jgi:hypothetical protein